MTSVSVRDTVPFAQRLAEAIAWGKPRASRANARHSLRSYELLPWLLSGDRHSTVLSVLGQRANLLRPGPSPVQGSRDLAGGRLLVYFPDMNLADGAAEELSNGFFDVENTPPWDVWVALSTEPEVRDPNYRTYLIAWVPSVLVELADEGIQVNPEGCICWLENAPIAARDELRALLR